MQLCAIFVRHSSRPVVFALAFGLVLTLAGPSFAFQNTGRDNSETPTEVGAIRYGWKPDQTAVYEVTVEVERDDYFDILQGTPTFHVKSADADQVVLTFQGSLSATMKAKPGRRVLGLRPPGVSIFSPFSGVAGSRLAGRPSEITINRRGEIVRAQGSSQLPYLLGNLSQLMLETLPDDNQKTWTVNNNTSISQSNSRIPLPRALADRDQTTTSAKEETVYTIAESSADAVVISKKYELRTAETIDGKPAYEITGSGKLTFDKKLGIFSALEFEQRNVVREENSTIATPVKVRFRLLDEAEQKRLAAAAREARQRAQQPPDEEEREAVLADLKSGEQARFLKRLISLQRQVPAMPDEDMAMALVEFLKHDSSSIRFAAAKALNHWATPKSTPALLAALEDDMPIVRHAAMDSLAQLRSKQAVQPIADRLADAQDRFKASKILQEMGSLAEEAVLKHADHKAWEVRNEVCVILKQIGTSKSNEALTKLLNDSNALVKRRAQEALDTIAKRRVT